MVDVVHFLTVSDSSLSAEGNTYWPGMVSGLRATAYTLLLILHYILTISVNQFSCILAI